MEEKSLYTFGSALMLARFMLFIFILVIAIMFYAPIHDVAQTSYETMSCSEDFTFMCFLAKAALPLIFIIVIALGIKYLTGDRE